VGLGKPASRLPFLAGRPSRRAPMRRPTRPLADKCSHAGDRATRHPREHEGRCRPTGDPGLANRKTPRLSRRRRSARDLRHGSARDRESHRVLTDESAAIRLRAIVQLSRVLSRQCPTVFDFVHRHSFPTDPSRFWSGGRGCARTVAEEGRSGAGAAGLVSPGLAVPSAPILDVDRSRPARSRIGAVIRADRDLRWRAGPEVEDPRGSR
jgi:hypothetical protein